MKLSDIGERKVVKDILSLLENDIAGDDSAYIPLDDVYLLISSDMVRKSTHLPDVMSAREIGWFVASINLSDIAAMGGDVTGLLLSLSIPSSLEEDFVLSIIDGAKECVEKFGGKILGGDTKEHDEITICGTAVGTVPKDEILLRSGARPGDIVAVTGTLGKAGAGYLAVKNSIEEIPKTGLIRPIPRVEEGRKLAENRWATSCIDISDGLSSSLYQLSDASGVGFLIYRDKIPVDPLAFRIGEILDVDPYSIAIDFGGDYELLVTVREDKYDDAKKHVKLTEIGRVIRERDNRIVCHGVERRLYDGGYEHFRQ